MPRTLSEQEFNALRDQVLAKLPAGLKEDEFNRLVGPAMEQAIGIAENSPTPLVGSAMGRALSSLWDKLPNPVDLLKGTAETVAAVTNPGVFASRVIGGQAAQSRAMAEKAAAAQSPFEKVGYGAAAIMPGGAAFAQAGEDIGAQLGQGDYAGAAGSLVGTLAPVVAPAMVPRGVRVPGPLRETTNPAEQQAIALARQRGVPVDAGTLTGSRFVRNVQKRMEGTIGGAAPVAKFQEAKDAALTRVGGELAEGVSERPATAQSAGAAIKASTEDTIRTLDDIAEREYGQLRAMENDPKYQRFVPNEQTAARVRLNEQAEKSLGRSVPADEWRELRRIREEMDAIPYSEGGMAKDTANYNQGTYVRGAAGAPVYDDILQASQGTSQMTRGEVLASLDRALKTGVFTNAARGALDVARQRLTGGGSGRGAMLPETASDSMMGLPVRVVDAKASLKPVYERLKREAELVPLQGDRARALTALDRLMTGPDVVPVSIADAALSDLKAMARGAAMPELRTKGQGLAAEAVKQLEQTVQGAVRDAGPEAVGALTRGRGAVRAKAAAGETLAEIQDEPVRAFKRATARQDVSIEHLKRLEETAPDAIPQVARAWLDEQLTKATEAGKFEHADRIYADWQKLGPETKRKLFGERTPDLDAFFLLAKKLNENPNPSGTANVLAVNATQVLSYLPAKAITKMLYSPRGARLLTQGLRLSLRPATRAAGMAAIQEAARAARIDLALPTAADSREGQTPQSAQRQ
jgi:hypothetical protein